VAREIVEPAVAGHHLQDVSARYTVREIFSTKRVEIQQAIETELAARGWPSTASRCAACWIGKIDLPAEYRRGMHELLAEELAAEKMRYTLDLKAKRVKETELEGEADKVRREKAAEAMARTQIIAARAQEEVMKYVLPLKERQIEQAQARSRRRKGGAHPPGRGYRRSAAHRGEGRSGGAADVCRRRGLPPRAGRQGGHRADGARGYGDVEAPAAHPEGAGRQALRQSTGDHRRRPPTDGSLVGAVLGGKPR